MTPNHHTLTGSQSMDTPTATAVRILPGERRSPHVVVDVDLGAFGLVLAVGRLKRGNLVVRWPISPEGNGAPALSLPADLHAATEAVAIQAVKDDPAAARHLLTKPRREARQ